MSAVMPPVAILAGGLARRMRPATDTMPKSLLPVAVQPFVAHQLRLLRDRGAVEVVLLLGHLGQQVERFVGDGSRFGLRVGYSWDGDRARGTGGALRNALPLLGERFFVLYGDSYLDVALAPIAAAFARSAAPALMTVFRNEGRWERSNATVAAGRVVAYDKKAPDPAMRHVDYGLGLWQAGALGDALGPDPADLADAYGHLAAAGQLAGYEVHERFYEIGSPRGLAETDAYLRARAMGSG